VEDSSCRGCCWLKEVCVIGCRRCCATPAVARVISLCDDGGVRKAFDVPVSVQSNVAIDRVDETIRRRCARSNFVLAMVVVDDDVFPFMFLGRVVSLSLGYCAQIFICED